MSTEAVAKAPVTMPTLSQLQERVRRLEEEAAVLRSDMERIARSLESTPPVATYIVDGETFTITEADVTAVRAQLVKPRSEETVRELALVNKMAERHQSIPKAKREQRFWKNIEAIRTEAIAKDIAIDDPVEAATW